MRLVFDFETTGAQRNKGHPFDYVNKACNIGFRDIDTKQVWIFSLEYDDEPYGENLKQIQELLDKTTLLIGFNMKFDIHWLRRYNLNLSRLCRIFDCQGAFFIKSGQMVRYPSLNGVAEHFGAEAKLDVVKEEYWDKGLDTDQVPYRLLCEYLEQDLVVTEQVFFELQKWLESSSFETKRVVSVTMQDLLVLEDMEWNGMLFNRDKSIRKGDELETTIEGIDNRLREIFGQPWANINSGEHLSACLYGGTVLLDGYESYTFVYKDGREAEKQRKVKVPHTCKPLFSPLEGTALAKEGFYSTDVGTLKKLGEKAKGVQREVIELLTNRSKLEKRRGTYFHGIPKKAIEFNWEDNVVHANLNQCVARTGRLSSDKPNLQNIEEDVKEVFITRFSYG